MAENINGTNLLSSGGHAWRWGGRPVARKRILTVGLQGESSITLNCAGRPLEIVGRDGGPALLKASGANRAAADAALDVLEAAIESLVRDGTACTWEDDAARTGSYLVLTEYDPAGPREYSLVGTTWYAWQFYRLAGVELAGRP